MTNQQQFSIHNQLFGFELEFGGIMRSTATRVVSEVLGGTYSVSNVITDQRGRKWKIVNDGSVHAQGGQASELVSPPLMMEDMDKVQEVIRALRRAGAKVDSSCGMHVHVDLANYNVKTLKNLVKYYAKYENMFYNAAKVLPNRAGHYAKKLNDKHPNLVAKIGEVKDLDDLKKLWYGRELTSTPSHYDNSRYAGLNLHNIWYKGWYSGTVEFRLFNGTLHAGEVRSYITLALAISAKALNAKSVNSRKNNIVEDVYLFPKILGGLGITYKDEITKNVYKHLTKSMRTA